jgi:hypothetical protein
MAGNQAEFKRPLDKEVTTPPGRWGRLSRPVSLALKSGPEADK